jgi:hypothetical protein
MVIENAGVGVIVGSGNEGSIVGVTVNSGVSVETGSGGRVGSSGVELGISRDGVAVGSTGGISVGSIVTIVGCSEVGVSSDCLGEEFCFGDSFNVDLSLSRAAADTLAGVKAREEITMEMMVKT